ncbi:unnamed protein product [Brassica rapa subsp. trilocularis]
MFTFMDAARVKPALSTNPPSEVDRLSSLPDSLIFQMFLNLPTKDVVQTSVLSTRWKTLWKDVHGLDLDTEDFNTHETFVSFVDNFLERNRGLSIHLFKVTCDSSYKPDLINRWVDTAVRLKVEHLDVSDNLSAEDIMMNPTVYTCSSLVSLRIVGMILPSPERVSLPSLKDIVLIVVEYTNPWALEKLISQCPVLEIVSIDRIYDDGMPILRVRSQSLLSFMHYWDTNDDYEKDRIVEIDAPMLKCLRISDGGTASFIIKNQPSLVEADIVTVFSWTTERLLQVANEIQKRDMVRVFSLGSLRMLVNYSPTIDVVIYDYARYVQLPVFRNLYTLCIRFNSYMWEMLPVFLEVCPNLKTLAVGTSENPKMVDLTVIARTWNLLSSLEHVDIERPLKGEALEMAIVGYLLENSPNLKKLSLSLHDSLKKGKSVHKLTLSLDDAPKKKESDIFIELLNFSRLSSSCQIIVR